MRTAAEDLWSVEDIEKNVCINKKIVELHLKVSLILGYISLLLTWLSVKIIWV